MPLPSYPDRLGYLDRLARMSREQERQRSVAERLAEYLESSRARADPMYAPDRIDLGVWPFCWCLDPIVFGHRRLCHGPLAGVPPE